MRHIREERFGDYLKGLIKVIKCFDKNGQELHLNDYVLIKTNIGMHEGYVRVIGRDKVHVNCLVGEFWIAPNNIYKKS